VPDASHLGLRVPLGELSGARANRACAEPLSLRVRLPPPRRYNEQGVLHLPPLKPGDALWPEIGEAAAQKARLEAAAAEAEAAAGGSADAEGVGSLEAVPPSGPDAGPGAPQRVVVLVTGPQLSGKTTQVGRWARVRPGCLSWVELAELLACTPTARQQAPLPCARWTTS
jgi:hypothetical protein